MLKAEPSHIPENNEFLLNSAAGAEGIDNDEYTCAVWKYIGCANSD
jgi:hypothetical protein